MYKIDGDGLPNAACETFDELVLRWMDTVQGLCKEDRLRVLRRTHDSLVGRTDSDKTRVVVKAGAALRAAEALTDPRMLRQIAVSISKGCTAAATEGYLAPCCMLTMRIGSCVVQRLTSVGEISSALAAQNMAASKQWGIVSESQAWVLDCGERTCLCVWTVFATEGGVGRVTFHDEHLFDACARVTLIERTLLVDCIAADDEVQTVLPLCTS
ncbi:hypothetical protein, conserved [Trypanosoma brucei gambiense DAL972]|uniref:Uncharacterized protein n=1 Tax=Trypanosoma brucei gambiense (strain MHOM/CI/86/DAL972) TaxID=679716 RepID=D0A8Y6_TRYB9|nr:hypothetical protein, conserved [Trypanosoma brucei gambiense DAL972]CBH18137.1 hypothetical protein, conserved [Trypanosoma brucei gambiense DAL972]|eukprot:XP_011780401.1 hypothetical protein, conserved [Trypanosoma brucei gambiense DAL972]